MAQKPRGKTRTARAKKPNESTIPDPIQTVASTTVIAGPTKIKIPTLTLRGEWLKAAGFPPGASCYVILDRRGEIAVNRLGLSTPRWLRIIAK